MALVGYYPTLPVRPLFGRELADFDRWFDEAFAPASTCDWCPRADVVEEDKDYQIAIELPGMEKDQVKVTVEQGVLTVSGENTSEHEEEGKGVRRIERRYGTFARSFELPDDVDAERIAATFKNGLLKLTVPKTVEAAPRKVEIKE